ncbi:hypothetical protein RMB03_06515 [Acinetobacter sp. V91_7]|uniref:hypothetical protein n=1 Tax=unclassified Acinetobacter TaxID=196816 RepID=UPI00287EA44F|nr:MULTISPECIES: hypothetical protein [unclassified Acinetobacter]MDS7934059.1 hypothetical protein [Acinetobacter sp. V91_4B]MDS7962605.1 hypothetical protein [Acinetobacter sp. V91_7]MDS8029492.1 hypothetical protein [Acinetobacter sp. V91_13]
MMFFSSRIVLVCTLLIISISLLGCRPISKNEFNTHCVWSGHALSQCNCIYNALEEHYSPQFVEDLEKISLQNIDANMNFVETMNETIHQCQLSARKDPIN